MPARWIVVIGVLLAAMAGGTIAQGPSQGKGGEDLFGGFNRSPTGRNQFMPTTSLAGPRRSGPTHRTGSS